MNRGAIKHFHFIATVLFICNFAKRCNVEIATKAVSWTALSCKGTL
ncbi:hypothetical protein HMPREF1869_01502 [Bacteroidales bacterium KA00251]|nr:hypothetical protein HMPREF1869_01502 [Bacteroidales bacterium KA00251]